MNKRKDTRIYLISLINKEMQIKIEYNFYIDKNEKGWNHPMLVELWRKQAFSNILWKGFKVVWFLFEIGEIYQNFKFPYPWSSRPIFLISVCKQTIVTQYVFKYGHFRNICKSEI